MSDPEALFQAVARRDWPEALRAVHLGRDLGDDVAAGSRRVLVDSVRAALNDSDSDSGLSDEDLEKMILLHRSGVLVLSDADLDRIAESLVVRNRHRPERALQFARYRPEADACRGLLAQFERPRATHKSATSGRTTTIDAGTRLDGRRPVFRSRQERVLFAAATRVFAGKLVVPNAALHSAVDFDSVRGLLNGEDRQTFFRVLLDLVVFDPDDDFRASWFFELDSPWHDSPGHLERDGVKERMLALAGCRLTRIRPSGEVDLSAMQDLIMESMRE